VQAIQIYCQNFCVKENKAVLSRKRQYMLVLDKLKIMENEQDLMHKFKIVVDIIFRESQKRYVCLRLFLLPYRLLRWVGCRHSLCRLNAKALCDVR